MNRRMLVNTRTAEEEKSSGWNSFGEYMTHKVVKLRQQRDRQASEFTAGESIEALAGDSEERDRSTVTVPALQGVVAWVNGRIKLEQNEIRRIVLENGGLVEHYYTVCSTGP